MLLQIIATSREAADLEEDKKSLAIELATTKAEVETLKTRLEEIEATLQTVSSDFSDVVFDVGGVHIPAHKNILSARYEYFRALFSSGMKESNSSRVEVKDMDAQLFKEVLRFIYTGRLPNDLMSKGAAYLPISDFYGMDDLKLACSNALGKTLTADNVEEALILARAHHSPDLSTACSDAMKGLIGTENVINYLLTASQYELSDLKEECLRHCSYYIRQNTLKRQTIELLKDHPELLWEIVMLR